MKLHFILRLLQRAHTTALRLEYRWMYYDDEQEDEIIGRTTVFSLSYAYRNQILHLSHVLVCPVDLVELMSWEMEGKLYHPNSLRSTSAWQPDI